MSQDHDPKLSLTYAVDFNDLFAASAVMAGRRYPASHRWKLFGVILGVMCLGGFLAAGAGTAVSHLVPGLSPWPVMILLLGVLATFYAKVMTPWSIRQSAKVISGARPPGEMTFSSDDAGMRWVDRDIDFKLAWSGVEAIYCTPGALAFMSGAIALVLPFAAFSDRAAIRSFLEDALERVPRDAREASRKDKSIVALLSA